MFALDASKESHEYESAQTLGFPRKDGTVTNHRKESSRNEEGDENKMLDE
jgi:hypothetical protein